jgi:NADH-quinone oxidoreductase subunit E
MRIDEERPPMSHAQSPTSPAAGAAALPPALLDELKALTTRYPTKRGALLLMLNRIQEQRGWIAPADMRLCGDLVQLSAAEVYSVVTFYTMYRTRPGARFPIGVCRNIACWVSGAEQLTADLSKRLGVAPGGTTADGNFSLQEVECLGSCGSGPCLEIDSRYFENVDAGKAGRIVDALAHSDGDATDAIEHAAKAAR